MSTYAVATTGTCRHVPVVATASVFGRSARTAGDLPRSGFVFRSATDATRLAAAVVLARPLQCDGLLDRVRRNPRARYGVATRAKLVHLLRHRRALVLQRDRVTVFVDRAQRLVDLDELTVRQPLDDARFDTVFQHLV